MKKNRLIHLLLIFPIILFAQSKAITGTVVDENKMPLPGASILVKGLNIGSSTDFDGNFSLNVPETGEVLVVSYLGYMTKELVISKNLTFNIQLDIDTNTLDEIVVVGYGTQRKSDITGSVTSVKVDAIAVAQNSTIDALLQGRAAGVQVTQNAGSPGSGVSVKIGRGEAVGLIGSSGSGKSTLVDILLGLLEPNSGKVLVDGSDIHDDLRGWQDQIGYVPQSIFLTDDTLRRNVAFGLPKDKIDDDAVRSAIRSAQLEEFVASLPDGMETVVGERGVRLSGGQRQRIGIARALYNNPDVLVLDEATSSLDTETEHGVMQAVQALQGDKTVIIVAHRLSTVEYCDRLYRLENAQIVDEGTFSEVTSRTKDLPRDADQK